MQRVRIVEWDVDDRIHKIKNITEVEQSRMFTKKGISAGITRVLADLVDRAELVGQVQITIQVVKD